VPIPKIIVIAAMPRRSPRVPPWPARVSELFWATQAISWKEVSQQYRNYLFVHGSLHTKTRQPAFDLATAQTVVDQQNGELSLPERLRCRIRYFTDGLIVGSQSFVESHFDKLKQKLGYQRRRPATRLTALGCADTLWVFRDLRVRTIG
jgi:putative transposase